MAAKTIKKRKTLGKSKCRYVNFFWIDLDMFWDHFEKLACSMKNKSKDI